MKTCRENDIKPIGGIEFRNGNEFLYTGVARNNEGMRELNEFVTYHNINKLEYPRRPHYFENANIIYSFQKTENKKLNDNEYIGVRPGDVLKLFTSDYAKKQSRLVIHQPITFADKKGFELHRNLRAVDNNILLSQLTNEMLANETEYFMSTDQIVKHFRNYPQIVVNTEKMLSECGMDYDFKSFKNKKTFTRSIDDDHKLLSKLSYDGLEYRYGKNNKTARQRVENELNIIFKLGFASYFLITWDMIRYSMSRGLLPCGAGEWRQQCGSLLP